MDFDIIITNKKDFDNYEKEILDIYMDAGTTGYMEQHLDKDKEKNYISKCFDEGYGLFAIKDSMLIGFMIMMPLKYDLLLPDSIKQKYNPEKCLYVAEMAVHKEFRGNGVGTKLMNKFIKTVDVGKYEFLFIRSWRNNKPAISFYQKFGFILGDIIKQNKIKKDRKTKFVIEKQYLSMPLK